MDELRDIPIYTFPEDTEEFNARFWTIKQAAEHWGVHYTTAKRLIERHAEALGAESVRVIRPHGDGVRLVIRAGSARPSADSPGNPQFRDPALQRQRALERWDREKTEVELLEEDVRDMTTLACLRSEVEYRRSPLTKVDYDALLRRIDDAESRIGQRGNRREVAALQAQIEGGG